MSNYKFKVSAKVQGVYYRKIFMKTQLKKTFADILKT